MSLLLEALDKEIKINRNLRFFTLEELVSKCMIALSCSSGLNSASLSFISEFFFYFCGRFAILLYELFYNLCIFTFVEIVCMLGNVYVVLLYVSAWDLCFTNTDISVILTDTLMAMITIMITITKLQAVHLALMRVSALLSKRCETSTNVNRAGRLKKKHDLN